LLLIETDMWNSGITNHRIIFAFILALFLAAIAGLDFSEAASPKTKYYQAESCYRELRTDAQKRKYRQNWLRCIEKFESVHRMDPSGPYAAAGLYGAAGLYRELAKYSGKASDNHEARDRYERIVNRFPRSGYHKKAQRAIQTLSSDSTPPKAAEKTKTPVARSAKPAKKTARNAYYEAEACYNELRGDSKRMKYRHNWRRCADKFHTVYELNPTGPWAAAGLYMTGKLYLELYKWSQTSSDLVLARNMFEQIVEKFPKSRYKIKSAAMLVSLPRPSDTAASAESKPLSPPSQPPVRNVSPASGGRVTVDSLRFWSNPSYTRIVIDADSETSFYHHLLKRDQSLKKPQRLYVDLSNSRLGKNIKKLYPIHDDLLIDARAGQNTPDTVRVVVDIKSFENYNIFSLRDPFRIVIDIRGKGASKTARKRSPVILPDDGSKLPPNALAKQLALGVSRIVIDPGHGGKDFGAPGCKKGVHEKYVVMQIANRLAKKIRKELKCEVLLTRTRDKFLTLEERTAFANTKNADLFISIHTNSHRDRRAYGIETYFLNLATDDEAIRVAAMENATSTKNISDLQSILFDLMQNAKINESSRLAVYVQTSLIRHLKQKRWTRIKDKGVKQAPFYVLLGATMPSILVETSFISNTRECNRLTNAKYQERLCEGIVKGVKRYIKETSPTAFRNPRQSSGSGG
jgi:N-acetylmuramoyl-L-alanine amidase